MKTQPNYLVTGAAGMIGARWVESCNRLKIPVVSIDHEAAFRFRPEHNGLDFGQKIFLNASLDELTEVKSMNNPVSAIIHLGAITNTREMNDERLKLYNLQYSKHLWNFAVDNQIPFLYASSAATYGDGTFGYEDDESTMHRLKPLNPYGMSKLQFDLWVLEQEKEGRTPPHWAGFKFFNVYGFGETHKDSMASVVLHAFRQICETQRVKLFKSHRNGIPDGHQMRDFIYVKDVISVLHYALKKPIKRGIYNLGTGNARTFLDLACATFTALNEKVQIEWIETPENLRDQYQYFTEAPMQKLRSLGYSQPFTSLEKGVSEYVSRLKTQKV